MAITNVVGDSRHWFLISLADLPDGAARRTDARRVGRALLPRGQLRRPARVARSPCHVPGLRVSERALRAGGRNRRASLRPVLELPRRRGGARARRADLRGSERRERVVSAGNLRRAGRRRPRGRRRLPAGRPRGDRDHGVALRRLPPVAPRVPARPRDLQERRRRGRLTDSCGASAGDLRAVKSGFVAVAGRPNVGKSTLVNALCGGKVAIVSDKPHTTRRRIAGVANGDGHQLVLVDLPGFQRPLDPMTERMQHTVDHGFEDVDAVVIVLVCPRADRRRRQLRRQARLLPRGARRDRSEQGRQPQSAAISQRRCKPPRSSATSTRCTR